jgi:2-methylcitrate dehydratase PrpD
VYHHGWWEIERPIEPIGAQMNIAYALAVGVIDGAAMVRQFSPARITGDDVWALIPRIKALHNPAFDQLGPNGRGKTVMRVRFRDGTVLEGERAGSRAALTPIAADEIREKYRTVTAGLIDDARRDAIERVVLKLESVTDLRDLTDLLSAPVGAAFD